MAAGIRGVFIRMPKQKRNWIVDAVLFTGFLLAFFLDWTGLLWHEWLGVAVGLIAFYHLLVHWKWVNTITKRFFSRTSKQSRLYYLFGLEFAAQFPCHRYYRVDDFNLV